MSRHHTTDEDRALAAAKATELWQTFTKNEKNLVRFGMFPAEHMRQAEAAGINGHALACSLMDCAKADGGMRA